MTMREYKAMILLGHEKTDTGLKAVARVVECIEAPELLGHDTAPVEGIGWPPRPHLIGARLPVTVMVEEDEQRMIQSLRVPAKSAYLAAYMWMIEQNRDLPWTKIQKLALPTDTKMSLLALKFHVFGEDRPSLVVPWDASNLTRWALGPDPSPSVQNICAFLLTIYNNHPFDVKWPKRAQDEHWWPNLPRFDIAAAKQSWDARHWRAFVDWVNAPWTA